MSITVLIIAITALISYQGFSDPALVQRLVFHPASIKNRGEVYRFITHGFIHKDFNHLLFNMWALYIFGSTTEQLFAGLIFPNPLLGRVMYLVFYVAAIAAASYVSFVRHQDNYGYSALGASGAVAAMMWPYVFYAPWNWFIFPPLPAILLGPLYIWYSNYMDKRGGGTVGHNAHLWGAIFGLVFYVVLLVFRKPELLEYFFLQLLNPQGPSFM
ncbi:MAG: rhomboid family intramembrane serine protease [Bacteroidota bacterium]